MAIPRFSAGELAIFAALVILIFLYPRLRRASTAKSRAAVFTSMGFIDAARDEVFTHADVLARLIYDRQIASIADRVGKGTTAIGETVIFDFVHEFQRGNEYAGAFTVVGFRVPAAVPEFQIEHVLPLERVLHVSETADIEPPATIAPFDRHTHTRMPPPVEIPILKRVPIETPPEFATNYRVWTSDATAIRRVLTPAALEALAAAGGGHDNHLRVMKRMDWLLVFHWTSSVTSPEKYPALVDNAVQLARTLDLRATEPLSATIH